ncbi:MFS transporter [Aestuariibacter salexigens]|uniref:MFS transporter n=1 Tax=Aestuariibacter salexigens TaxID=226010 RepID=UPI0004264783|nr:MFS transporter [Aestuariibacter salexigens]
MPTPSESARFVRLIIISTCTKLADILMSAKTTLPWLLSSIGAPGWMISTLVPIREAGSLIPQWPVRQSTSDIRNRLKLWRYGIVAQGLCIGLMVPAVLILPAFAAGLTVIILLALMSIGRSLCSLTMKDIQGHNVSKGKRGRLNGTATTVSGLLSFLSAAMLLLGQQGLGDTALLVMLTIASVLFLVTLPVSSGLASEFDKQEDQQEGLSELVNTVQNDTALKHLVISRCLLLHGALVAPYFVSVSMNGSDSNFSLPFFIAASAAASFISSYLWGKLSDDSAVRSLQYGSMICVVACVGVALLPLYNGWTPIIGFLILNIGYAGIRNGRKTYVLDIAEDDKRSQYVAAGNTIVGVVLLLLGGIYALAYAWLDSFIITLMAVALALGGIHTVQLKREK